MGARLCLKKGELEDIEEDWNLALNYLNRISSKSISAERCLKVLEVMHSQISILPLAISLIIDASPKVTQGITPKEVKPEPPVQTADPPYDPLSVPTNIQSKGPGDWDMQELVWSNLPWDWNLMDDLLVDGIDGDGLNGGTEPNWGWGNIDPGDGQANGDQQGQAETMGMPVL